MKTEKDLIQSGSPDEDPKPGTDEADGEVAPPQDSESNALARTANMLPGIRLSQNALVVATQRRELYNHITQGYAKAAERIRSYKDPKKSRMPTDEALALTVAKHNNALAVVPEDALETVRKQLGLDKLRDELIAELRARISVDEGIRLVEEQCLQYVGRRPQGMNQIARIFPYLTTGELALFPLLSTFPLLYWYCSPMYKDTGDDPLGMWKGRIPQPHFVSATGMTFVRDDFQSHVEDDALREIDEYRSLGLTGVRTNQFYVEFAPDIARILKQLIPLTMTNNRLFQRVWRESSEAAQIALGRIEHHCLEELLGETFDVAAVPIEVARESVSAEHRAELECRCRKIEKNIAAATIFDLSCEELLDPMRVFRLVGLLASLPKLFLEEKPFAGYSMPFGSTIRFLDMNGAVVDQVPLHPTFARDAIEGVHYEGESESRDNRTTHNLLALIRREVVEQTLTRLMEDDEYGSASERTAAKLWMDRGVTIDVTGGFEIIDTDNSAHNWYNTGLTSKHIKTRFVKKIGPEESVLLAATLGTLPPTMFKRIHAVRKLGGQISIFDRMAGVVTLGRYAEEERRIDIVETLRTLFPNASLHQKIGLQFTLLHECGEAMWTLLTEEKQAEWEKFSWPKKRKPLRRRFLTWYSTTNEKEDFCEHFAAFVVHGREFRARAAAAKVLKRKYNFLAALFKEYAGMDLHYPGTEQSIHEIHGALRQRRKELSIREAVEQEEIEAEDDNRIARNTWGRREDIDDFEAAWEEEALREESEHGDKPVAARKRAEDWDAIAAFEQGERDPGGRINLDEEELRGKYHRFRVAVVDIVKDMPRTRGRVHRIAAALCPIILEENEEAVAEELEFLPTKIRKDYIGQLLKLKAESAL